MQNDQRKNQWGRKLKLDQKKSQLFLLYLILGAMTSSNFHSHWAVLGAWPIMGDLKSSFKPIYFVSIVFVPWAMLAPKPKVHPSTPKSCVEMFLFYTSNSSLTSSNYVNERINFSKVFHTFTMSLCGPIVIFTGPPITVDDSCVPPPPPEGPDTCQWPPTPTDTRWCPNFEGPLRKQKTKQKP